MQHANISRCNFMKALHRSAPLEVAHGPAPFRYRSTRLMVWHSRSCTLGTPADHRALRICTILGSVVKAQLTNIECVGSATTISVQGSCAAASALANAWSAPAGLGVRPRAQKPAAERSRLPRLVCAQPAVHHMAVVRSARRMR